MNKKEGRYKILIGNLITFLETEYFEYLSKDDKIKFLKEEIGFTDEEIEEFLED